MIYFYLIVKVHAPHATASDRKKFTSGKISFKGGENAFFKKFFFLPPPAAFRRVQKKGSAAERNHRGTCNLLMREVCSAGTAKRYLPFRVSSGSG